MPDSIAPNPDADSDRPAAVDPALLVTAYHEAGHAVMALLLGRPVQKVTISPRNLQTGGVRLGICQMKKGRVQGSQDPLEDEVLILLAGMVGEAQLTGRFCTVGAAEDLRGAQRLLLSRAGNPRHIERMQQRLLDKAQHLLSSGAASTAIESIAAELVQKTTLSGRAVRHHFHHAQHQH